MKNPFVMTILSGLIFCQVNASAFSQIEWKALLDKVEKYGKEQTYEMVTLKTLAYISRPEARVNHLINHKAEYLSLVGPEVQMVAEIWTTKDGKTYLDQWLFRAKQNGEVFSGSHNLQTRDFKGNILHTHHYKVSSKQIKQMWQQKINAWIKIFK